MHRTDMSQALQSYLQVFFLNVELAKSPIFIARKTISTSLTAYGMHIYYDIYTCVSAPDRGSGTTNFQLYAPVTFHERKYACFACSRNRAVYTASPPASERISSVH